MIFLDTETGHCRQAVVAPGTKWRAVPGRGTLFRRLEESGWRAEHAYTPDSRLWTAEAWERVRFRPAAPACVSRRGHDSGIAIAFAPPTRADEAGLDHVWVILPQEPGIDAPAERPGAQALFKIQELREGAIPIEVTERLLRRRIVALGLDLDAALWVLKGPPVSPDDARIVRRLHPIIALASRLAKDLARLVLNYEPPAQLVPISNEVGGDDGGARATSAGAAIGRESHSVSSPYAARGAAGRPASPWNSSTKAKRPTKTGGAKASANPRRAPGRRSGSA